MFFSFLFFETYGFSSAVVLGPGGIGVVSGGSKVSGSESSGVSSASSGGETTSNKGGTSSYSAL